MHRMASHLRLLARPIPFYALSVVYLIVFSTNKEVLSKDWDFASDIRPILTEKCLGCHSGEKPAGGLALADRDKALGAGESGAKAIIPHQPNESELIRRITSSDADLRMPPEDEKPLTDQEKERLKAWIEQGAPWSVHWAFRPIKDRRSGDGATGMQLREAIDQSIQHKLHEMKLERAPTADRYTLIKRLYYDLLGLPPSIVEVDAFVKDTSPQAYETLVDRLLQSPHFGERWGRHWLDLAHYADSDGYEKDRARPDAYLYRDWVIDAFNHDLPFDQFTIEQLAGDLLPGSLSKQKIATGFLRQTLTNEEGGVDQEEYRVAACFDRTETIGTVWLGLTVGCVRCHDHKYDPLLQSDYYQLFAFFNNAEETKLSLPISATDLSQLETELRPLQAAISERYRSLAADALAWETREHRAILALSDDPIKETRLMIDSVTTDRTDAASLQIKADSLHVLKPETVPDTDTYTLTFKPEALSLSGIKLHVLATDDLPGKGPGRAPNGNFVLTGVDLYRLRDTGTEERIALHRPKADYAQKGFPEQNIRLDGEIQTKRGWGIAGKLGANHSLQLRTQSEIVLQEGDQLKLVLRQDYGKQHVIGALRVTALSGDLRGLNIADESIAKALEMYPEKRVASTQQQLFDYYVDKVARDAEAKQWKAKIAELHKQYQAKLVEVRTIGTPRLVRTTHIFSRGDFLSPQAETVTAGTPQVLPRSSDQNEGSHSLRDRLDLAHWLVAPENPLTSRVAVNHVWQHLFGFGIVRTSNDFGTRGEPPTHPELLDLLAHAYAHELKWSRKALIREIVNSQTYQQSSELRQNAEALDPQNHWLHRQNRFRVESEVIRDLHLSVAGLLSEEVGGPSVFPPMPEDLAKLSYANSFTWKNSEGPARYRRGIYTFFKRTLPHPNMMTFDSPDANVACVIRTTSNTPLQSLTLLNNEVHVEAAQALSQRLHRIDAKQVSLPEDGMPTDSDRIQYAMRLCIARPAVTEEIQVVQQVLDTAREFYREHGDEAVKAIGAYHSKGIEESELAAWVAAVRVILNLDEFVTRE